MEPSVRSATSTCDLRYGAPQGRGGEVSCRSEALSCFPQGHRLCSSGKGCPASEPTRLAFTCSLQSSVYPPSISSCIQPETHPF